MRQRVRSVKQANNDEKRMISTVSEHYAKHLAPIYAWMVGDFEAACAVNHAFFDEIGLVPHSSALALDLGCGHGLQTIPLARRGFNVIAIDSSQLLLDQLTDNVENGEIQTINDDLLSFPNHLSSAVDVIVCMGDTITHLASWDDVQSLIQMAGNALNQGGTFCLSLRDYTSTEPKGTDRFIPVRADDNRHHVCFLDYQPKTVDVYDILHTRVDDEWQTAISGYTKLRLSPSDVIESAKACGFVLSHRSTRRGMLHLAFTFSTNH